MRDMKVHIVLRQDPLEDGRLVWSAASPDMLHWIAVADTLDEIKQLCVEALDFVLEAPDAIIEYRMPAGVSGDPSAAA